MKNMLKQGEIAKSAKCIRILSAVPLYLLVFPNYDT